MWYEHDEIEIKKNSQSRKLSQDDTPSFSGKMIVSPVIMQIYLKQIAFFGLSGQCILSKCPKTHIKNSVALGEYVHPGTLA